MIEKRYKLIKSDPCEDPYDCRMYVGILEDDVEELYDFNSICDRLNELADENKQLKKGMIEVVDRYIKNVDCNPPSSTRTYIKIKGALLNIREDLRDLIGDLDG